MTNQPFDFNSGPEKRFVDTAHLRIINGVQHLTFQSGKDLQTFVMVLPLAKTIARALTKQIEEVEKKTGRTIDSRLPDEPAISPWSVDMQKGGDTDAPSDGGSSK